MRRHNKENSKPDTFFYTFNDRKNSKCEFIVEFLLLYLFEIFNYSDDDDDDHQKWIEASTGIKISATT